MLEVRINSEGQKIDGTLFSPEHPKTLRPALVLFHGWTSQKGRHLGRADKLASLGLSTLAVSFRGHGESEGNFDALSRADPKILAPIDIQIFAWMKKNNLID